MHLIVQPDPVALRSIEKAESDRVGRIGGHVGKVGQQVEEDVVDTQGAEDHARDVAHAAEHDHDQDGDRNHEGEVLGAHEREFGAVIGPGKPAERGADREGQKFDGDRIHAGRGGGHLVFAHRHPGAAETRPVKVVGRDDAEDHEDHHQDVERQWIDEVEPR